MRSDVMFQRDPASFVITDQQERALLLFREAEQLEAQGNFEEACRKYRQSFKLDPELEKSYG